MIKIILNVVPGFDVTYNKVEVYFRDDMSDEEPVGSLYLTSNETSLLLDIMQEGARGFVDNEVKVIVRRKDGT